MWFTCRIRFRRSPPLGVALLQSRDRLEALLALVRAAPAPFSREEVCQGVAAICFYSLQRHAKETRLFSASVAFILRTIQASSLKATELSSADVSVAPPFPHPARVTNAESSWN